MENMMKQDETFKKRKKCVETTSIDAELIQFPHLEPLLHESQLFQVLRQQPFPRLSKPKR